MKDKLERLSIVLNDDFVGVVPLVKGEDATVHRLTRLPQLRDSLRPLSRDVPMQPGSGCFDDYLC